MILTLGIAKVGEAGAIRTDQGTPGDNEPPVGGTCENAGAGVPGRDEVSGCERAELVNGLAGEHALVASSPRAMVVPDRQSTLVEELA
jgi:hypothetical protein